MARRRRRPHQRSQTSSRPRSLSGAWLSGLSMWGRRGCHRWQPGGHRSNVIIGAIRLSRYKKVSANEILQNQFGAKHFRSPMHSRLLAVLHQKLVYAKNSTSWERNLLTRTEQHDKRYKNPDNDPCGVWSSSDMSARNYYSQGTYSIAAPSGRVIAGPPKGMYWRVSKETFEEMNKDNRIWWGKAGGNVPRIKRFLTEVQEG